MAGNNEIREMANAARSFEDRDFWDLYVRDRNGGFDHQRYQDEDYARDKYATFKGLVEDPASDVVFVRLVHETNPGKVPRYDDEGGAWKEEARELCRMERRFMERWTNEAAPAAPGVPENEWDEVFREAVLGEWDEGAEPGEAVQPGTWNGRGIEIVYRLPEDFEELMDQAEMMGRGDEYLRTLVAAVRYAEDE